MSAYRGELRVSPLVEYARPQLLPSYAPYDRGVVSLTDSNYRNYLATHTYTVVCFYVPGESWSLQFEPKLKEVAAGIEREEIPVFITSVNCAAYSALCTTNGVSKKEEVTVSIYSQGRVAHGFNYAPSVVGLMAAVKHQLKSRGDVEGVAVSALVENTSDQDMGDGHVLYWVLMLLGALLFFGFLKWGM